MPRTTASSFFACYTCGLEETFFDATSIRKATARSSTAATAAVAAASHANSKYDTLSDTNSLADEYDDDMRRSQNNNSNNNPMRKQSPSPVQRSRSSERLAAKDDDEEQYFDAEHFHDAVRADSTDNDSDEQEEFPAATTTTTTTSEGGADSDDGEIYHNAQATTTTPSSKKQQQRQQQTSVRSLSANQSQRGIHTRAMSDPFATPEMQDAVQRVRDEEQQREQRESVYPTLMRFPVAETRNRNCWSEPPVTIFNVRGPKYFSDKKKKTSAPYLLAARGTDLFLFEKTTTVRLEERSHLILGGNLRSLPTLAMNFQFPWGVMVLYFEVPAKLAPYLDNNNKTKKVPLADNLNNAERTLAKWLQGDDNYKNDRLKLIPYVAEGPWVVRNMVTGRPAIIGRKLPVTYRQLPAGSGGQAPLCECTLDVGSSSATAKRIVSVCRRYMSGLTSDIGFVIQAESPDELPEQMLGSIRVHHPDPLKAPKI